MPNHLPQVAEAFGDTGTGYNISGRAFAAPREKMLIPERKGSLRHKHSHSKHSSHDIAPKRRSSSGRSSGLLISGLSNKPTAPVEKKNLTHGHSRQQYPNQRKRRITLDDPRKLDIEVPGLGPGDPWAAGMGPEQQKEVREEQQKQYREAERRRSSTVSAFAEGSGATMRRVSKEESGALMQNGSLI
ncbi:hypothetical protein Q9L58_007254 [Maublancomyces gigas]|uniref:Uncharacterized protein n=1 Tax=Discina gigas TaxID=1032678 RepID=A0ABR3GDM5_9PEZI